MAGVPLSKFVIELVENALIEESDFKPRGELVKEMGKLRTENKELWDDLNQKKPFENSESTGSASHIKNSLSTFYVSAQNLFWIMYEPANRII